MHASAPFEEPGRCNYLLENNQMALILNPESSEMYHFRASQSTASEYIGFLKEKQKDSHNEKSRAWNNGQAAGQHEINCSFSSTFLIVNNANH